MRPLPALLALTVLGCGGAAPAPETGAKPVVQAGLPEAFDPRVALPGSDVNYATPIDHPADLVWRALAPSYDSAGIKLNYLDADAHLMGNQGMSLKSKLGNTSLSTYIDCGRAQGAASADTYEVTMVVISWVHVAPSGSTEILTRVTASGRPATLGQHFTRCTSTTTLEKRLASNVKLILGK